MRERGDRGGLGAPTGPSGWHPDPWRRHHARFFDGRLWTEHVADGGVSSIDSAPVAEMARSRPMPPRQAPPEGEGPRVLGEGPGRDDPGLDHALLLVDLEADDDGIRHLRTPAEVTVGRVAAPPPSPLTRLGRRLVSAPGVTPSRLVVTDRLGTERLHLGRPGRRTAPVVDITGPDGPLGAITAESVRQGLRARLVDATGSDVGRLEQVGPDTESLRIVGPDDEVCARLTPVWDIPGSRHHLPPGVVLVDRRYTAEGRRVAPERGGLLLGALLAPLLVLPPAAPADADQG